MSVYMEPLIDDLVHAWEEGVWTYDRATKIGDSTIDTASTPTLS